MTTPISPLTADATSSPQAAGSSDATSGSSGSSGSSATGMNGLLDQSTFLNLLVDELKYQNPLDPTSSADFMSQIAQLSQVEQLQTLSTSSQLSDASSLIGKSITADSGNGTITGTVTGVTNGTSGPLLDVGGAVVGLSSVEQIAEPDTSG